MPLEILLISQDLQLANQLKKMLNSFSIKMRVSFEPLEHLLQQISGVVWDLNSIALPKNPSEIQIMRSQVAGPILLLDQTAEPVETICRYFLNYHLDDYIQKSPIEEIAARIVQKVWVYQNKDRLQITKQGQANSNLTAGHLKIDLDKFQVKNGHDRLSLSPIEYKLLLFFISHANTVLSRTQIASAVWGNTSGATLRIIDTHISNLRKKIEKQPKNPQMLKTIRGFGYLFKVENRATNTSQAKS
ncbi:winged helix-turn-helix domain-containing protein [Lentilactobacillus raoultii]|uniref:Winged helix-turn-helix domain-containing protein n=1 Tax=Lentilactobacillus raoultii TaxID=1987503 RepID=A0ABW3PP71_9LACO|nr:response regulator transcription factor [Lentilactobacillus raoultii]